VSGIALVLILYRRYKMPRLLTKGIREFEFMGVDIKKLISVHPIEKIELVEVILKEFPLYKPLTDYINLYMADIEEDRRMQHPGNWTEKRVASVKKKHEMARRKMERENPGGIVEPPPLTGVIGMCPRCGEPLSGLPVPRCEATKTGRVFYKECSACTYYGEIFRDKKTGEYTETEGG
jgi:hypothetical protein